MTLTLTRLGSRVFGAPDSPSELGPAVLVGEELTGTSEGHRSWVSSKWLKAPDTRLRLFPTLSELEPTKVFLEIETNAFDDEPRYVVAHPSD